MLLLMATLITKKFERDSHNITGPYQWGNSRKWSLPDAGVEEGARVRTDDCAYRSRSTVALGASHNYVILLLSLPKFPEALILNLPSCTAYGSRQAKRKRSFLHTRAT